MSDVRIPQPGDFYLHFKQKLYQIITVAIHSETRESLVIYQALYGDYKTYARPLDMFISEVDHEKYPDVEQKYRFQYLTAEELDHFIKQREKPKPSIAESPFPQVIQKTEETSSRDTKVTASTEKGKTYRFIDSDPKTLNDFLDANTNQERLEILRQMRTYVDDFTLDSIAVCLDYVPSGNNLEERYYSICKFLEMKINYESKRQ